MIWIGYNQTHNGTENIVNMYMYIITIKNSIQTERDKKMVKLLINCQRIWDKRFPKSVTLVVEVLWSTVSTDWQNCCTGIQYFMLLLMTWRNVVVNNTGWKRLMQRRGGIWEATGLLTGSMKWAAATAILLSKWNRLHCNALLVCRPVRWFASGLLSLRGGPNALFKRRCGHFVVCFQ